MSKENNLTDFLTDVADAIREKKGTADKINPQNFSDEIKGIKTSIWTGHADVEGLKAIGWDDEDIAYFQEHGVDWNEEDDEYYKVSDDNKSLYGVLTWDNIEDYKDRIVWLPKIIEPLNSGTSKFYDCKYMKGMPMFDTSNMRSMASMFINCCQLTAIPRINVDKVVNIVSAFQFCYSLRYLPLEFNKLTNPMTDSFNSCYSLSKGCKVVFSGAVGNTRMYSACTNIEEIPELDIASTINVTNLFMNNYNLRNLKLKNLRLSVSLGNSPLISKHSLLYILNNESATKAITITLHSSAYARLATDPDIVETLSNHPLVSLARV